MGTLTALILATPFFGLTLQLDPGYMPSAMGPASGLRLGMMQAGVDGGDDPDEAESDPSGPTVAEQMQARGRISPIHKWMGIATWASMTVTVALGWIQYNNLYGFFADEASNPCVEGNAVFGQGSCVDTPLPHLISSILTGALYSVTFGLSYRMPDPIGLDEGDGEYARNLRRHKRLRWVHFAGMIAQFGLGILAANAERFGLDRANDYRTLQAISTVHLAIGLVTYGTLTWAGLIFLL